MEATPSASRRPTFGPPPRMARLDRSQNGPTFRLAARAASWRPLNQLEFACFISMTICANKQLAAACRRPSSCMDHARPLTRLVCPRGGAASEAATRDGLKKSFAPSSMFPLFLRPPLATSGPVRRACRQQTRRRRRPLARPIERRIITPKSMGPGRGVGARKSIARERWLERARRSKLVPAIGGRAGAFQTINIA